MKLDTHVHTNYSDGLMSIDELRKLSLKKGIIPCITDHNTIKGAIAYQKKYGKNSCIAGEEICTKEGDIIGLYMKKEISPYLSIEETLKELKKQNAIIIVPHPFDKIRWSTPKYNINKLNKKYKIHFIEIFNARMISNEANKTASVFFEKNKEKQKYLATVGSDAHTSFEFGRTYSIVPDFNIQKKDEFLNAFKNIQKNKKIKQITKKSPVFVHIITKTIKILGLKQFFKRKL